MNTCVLYVQLFNHKIDKTIPILWCSDLQVILSNYIRLLTRRRHLIQCICNCVDLFLNHVLLCRLLC